MRILSLFDGMACGMLAMQEASIDVDRYVAYEIDKYAVQTSTRNFPMIEHRGDVFKVDFAEFEEFDYVIGGSPCTYWSIAQKNNRETEASGMGWELFSQYVRAIHEVKPKWFIYENNKSMSKAIRKSIDETFGFEAVEINSKLVSAQNRQRLYWVGKRNADGTYSKVNVEQPEDRGILLKDILESGVDLTSNDKSYCFTASYDGACAWNTIERKQRTMAAEPVGVGFRNRREEDGKLYRRFETHGEEKANALTTVQTDSMVAEPIRAGCYPSPDGTLKNAQSMRIYSINAKTVTQKASAGGMGAKTGLYAIPVERDTSYAIPCEWDEEGSPIKAISCADGKVYTVYEVKEGKITIKGKEYPIKLLDGSYIIRKLTVRECMRLQTIPEWYEFPVSDTQAYKMLGNGWTVQVIKHLIEATQNDTDSEEPIEDQISFYEEGR